MQQLRKLKNYYRRHSPQHRTPQFAFTYQLLTRVFSLQLARLQQIKWKKFLSSLHPKSSNLWNITRYFSKPPTQIPSFIHQGTQIYQSLEKANILAQTFASSHTLTQALSTPQHTLKVHRRVHSYLQNTVVYLPPLQKTNVYELKRKLKTLKSRSSPGPDGITPLMLRHLSHKALTYLT